MTLLADNETVLAEADIQAGQAVTPVALSEGALQKINAVYSGDDFYAASTSLLGFVAILAE